jgi:threonylcarbamoyladenosine tRNA methylthiotransferase MtaB
MRIAFTTLGCKINQYETDVLRHDFEAQGNAIVPFEAQADVYIINTCSVTAKSDYQCRQIIRSTVRRGQGAKVVVTGCYATMRPEEIKKIEGVDFVFSNGDKSAISEQVMSSVTPSVNSGNPVKEDKTWTPSVHSRTRGFLKIQDGCNNRCSYCIVPLARGSSRSVHPEEVIREFDRLVRDGCPEIVLSGIHIGSYGIDLRDQLDLTSLVKMLIAKKFGTRIRLSSIEPREITDEMIGLLGSGLCRHLHVPLQSGDDAILASMKRDYSADFYLRLLDRIANQVSGIALGADIMVGYPGEGDSEYNKTLELVEKAPLTHLHVFSFSPRPGTEAADMKNQVPDQVKKRRSDELRNLGMKKNLAFRKHQIGISLNIVVEDKTEAQSGLLTGLTDNYIRVQVRGAKSEHIGKKINAVIKDVKKEGNFAEIL